MYSERLLSRLSRKHEVYPLHSSTPDRRMYLDSLPGKDINESREIPVESDPGGSDAPRKKAKEQRGMTREK